MLHAVKEVGDARDPDVAQHFLVIGFRGRNSASARFPQIKLGNSLLFQRERFPPISTSTGAKNDQEKLQKPKDHTDNFCPLKDTTWEVPWMDSNKKTSTFWSYEGEKYWYVRVLIFFFTAGNARPTAPGKGRAARRTWDPRTCGSTTRRWKWRTWRSQRARSPQGGTPRCRVARTSPPVATASRKRNWGARAPPNPPVGFTGRFGEIRTIEPSIGLGWVLGWEGLW